ncbi:FYVE zinc finger containing protein [Novymonas esmeraldas]|uniref:FYVE zinc finger containing protein n=1 Tax=Novymonas esmeraldas TaxID=1808958 RepID=A0AAW0F5P6_9TRYP
MSLNVSLGPWKADSAVTHCELCDVAFNVFRRRHHCRCCGAVFCSACTNQSCTIPTFPSFIPQRVCRECHTLLTTREAGRSQRRDRALLKPAQRLPVLMSVGHRCTPSVSLAARQEGWDRAECGTDSQAPCTSQRESPTIFNGSVGGNMECSDVMLDSDDDDEDEDGVATAVAGVLTSSATQETMSVSFLPVLKDSIVQSGDLALLNVLLFPSPRCCTVTVVAASEEDTMAELVTRLTATYFNLASGPFKRMTDSAKEELRCSLHFYSEMQRIPSELPAAHVARNCSHVVLTTLSPEQFEKERDTASCVSSLRQFFNHERAVAVEAAD